MLNYWDKFHFWDTRAHDWSTWKREASSYLLWNCCIMKAAAQMHFKQQRTYSTSGMWKKVCGNPPCSQFRTSHQPGKAKVDSLSFPSHVLLRASFFTDVFTEKLGSNSLCLDLRKRWFYGNQTPTFWFRIRRLHNIPSSFLVAILIPITADWGYSSLSYTFTPWVLVFVQYTPFGEQTATSKSCSQKWPWHWIIFLDQQWISMQIMPLLAGGQLTSFKGSLLCPDKTLPQSKWPSGWFILFC